MRRGGRDALKRREACRLSSSLQRNSNEHPGAQRWFHMVFGFFQRMRAAKTALLEQ